MGWCLELKFPTESVVFWNFVLILILKGAATVYQGLETSWKILYTNLQHATVKTVDYKWAGACYGYQVWEHLMLFPFGSFSPCFLFFLFFPSYPPSRARSSSFVREFDLTFCWLFYWLDGWMVGWLVRCLALSLCL